MKKTTILIVMIFNLIGTGFTQDRLVFNALVTGSEVYEAIITEAYKRLNIKVKFKTLPLERALQFSNSGLIDGETVRGVEVLKLNPNIIKVPTILDSIPMYVYTSDKDILITMISELEDYSLVILRGMIKAEDITRLYEPRIANNIFSMYKMIDTGRVQIAFTAMLHTDAEIFDMGYHNIIKIEPPLFYQPLYHFLHKKHKDLIPKVDKVFQEMKDDGTIDKIKELY